jgi:DNA repair protein RadA/Sms
MVSWTIEKEAPAVVIVDSIQMYHSRDIKSHPGGVRQVVGCTKILKQYCKPAGMVVFLVAQITKDKKIAGPKSLEHITDANLMMTWMEDRVRINLQAKKNRFGNIANQAVFTMTEQGLEWNEESCIFPGFTGVSDVKKRVAKRKPSWKADAS